MRILLLVWTMMMFVLTCTNDVYQLRKGNVAFVIHSDPHWSALFVLEAWTDISWFEFAGHFFMFFILTWLLLGVFKRVSRAVAIAFVYSITTELIQPFFGRGAEGIDLLANTAGIILSVVYVFVQVGTGRRQYEKAEREESKLSAR